MASSRKVGFFGLFAVVAVSGVGTVVLLSGSGLGSTAKLAKSISAAKKVGLPLEISDLDIRPVPEEKNAAHIYRLLSSSFSKSQKEHSLIDTASQRDAGPKDIQAADRALPKISSRIALLMQVERYPECNFNRDWSLGSKLMFPELGYMKQSVTDLCYQADYDDRHHDLATARRELAIASRIAVHAGSDPILIGMLVEISARQIVNREITSMIRRHSSDPSGLARLETDLQQQAAFPQMRRYLAGEVVEGLRTIQTASSMRDLSFPSDSPAWQDAILRSSFVKTVFEGKFIDAWTQTWAKLPSHAEDWDGYSKPLKDMETAISADRSPDNLMNQVLLPVFSESTNQLGILLARHRLLLASTELLQIRARTGNLPKHLPSSLGELAIDPFDGDRLQYRRKGKGFVLYSVGSDRIDDGGVPRDPRSSRTMGFDEVVVIP